MNTNTESNPTELHATIKLGIDARSESVVLRRPQARGLACGSGAGRAGGLLRGGDATRCRMAVEGEYRGTLRARLMLVVLIQSLLRAGEKLLFGQNFGRPIGRTRSGGRDQMNFPVKFRFSLMAPVKPLPVSEVRTPDVGTPV